MVDKLSDILQLDEEKAEAALNNTLNTLFNQEEEVQEEVQPAFDPNQDVVDAIDVAPPEQFGYHQTAAQRIEERQRREEEQASWTEKYSAAADTMHLLQLGAESDLVNSGRFEDDPEFTVDEDRVKQIRDAYPEEWAEDLVKAQSEDELTWRMERADGQLESYKQLGEMGWGTGTAMAAAALTDPVTLGLSFATGGFYVPAAAARGVQYASQAARYASYMKRGAVVGAGEGLVVGYATMNLNPVGEAEDLLWFMAGGSVGGSLGGALGGKLRKSLDADLIAKQKIPLTPKGAKEFEANTPVREQEAVTHPQGSLNRTSKLTQAQVNGKKSQYVPVPSKWLEHDKIDLPTTPRLLNSTPDKFVKLSDEDALNVIDDVYGVGSLYRAQINKIKQNAKYVGMEKDIAAIRKQMDDFVKAQWSTKSVGELEARAYRAFLLKPRNNTKQQQNYDNKNLKLLSKVFDKDGNFKDAAFENFKRLQMFRNNGIKNRKIDGKDYVTRPWTTNPNGIAPVLSVSDGKKVKYITIATKGKKTGYFTSDELGNPKQFIHDDARKTGDAPWNAVRKIYKHRAATADDELRMQGKEALLEAFGANKKFDELTDADVPTLDTGVVGRNLSALARTASSKLPQVRSVAMKLGLVASGLKDDAGNVLKIEKNALSIQDMLRDRYMGEWARLNIKHQVNSNKMLGNRNTDGLTPEEFEENVFHIMNGTRPKYEITPRQQALANDRRALMNQIFDDAEKAGVVDLPAKLTDYMPRQYRYDKVYQMVKQFDEKDLKATFGRMVQTKIPNMPKDVAARAGAAYLKGIKIKVLDASYNKGSRFQAPTTKAHDRDSVMEMFELAGEADPKLKLTDEQLEMVIDAFKAENRKVRNKSPNIHARARMSIDDKGVYKVKLANSDEKGEFTLTDIIETNGERAFITYSWKMSGATALAQVGIDSEQTFSSMLNSLNKAYQNSKIDPDTAAAEKEALEYMYDSLRGSFIAKGSLTEQQDNFLRRVREMAFIVQMGQAGFAAMVEASNVAFEHGVKQFLKQFPEIMSTWSRAASGKLADDVLADFEAGGAGGTDILTGLQMNRFEDMELNDILRAKYTKTDEKLAIGRRIVSMAGLLSPVTVHLTRTHQRIMAQHFFDSFKKGKLNVYKNVKMKNLGLDDDKIKNIKTMFDKYAEKHTSGYRGLVGRVKTLNMELWKATPEGKQAYEDFMYAVSVDTKNTIQRTHVGSNNSLIRNSSAKTFLQFLSYPIAAHQQQFNRQLFRIKNGDFTPVKILMGGLVIAGNVYVAKIHLRTQGMSNYDKKKFLEKHLTPEKIIANALMYQGMFGVTTAFTSGARLGDPTGHLASVMAPPFLSYVTTAGQTAYDIGEAAFTDEEFFEADKVKKGSKLFGNLLPFQVLGNVAAEELD